MLEGLCGLHDLIDDELGVTMHHEATHADLDSDPQTVDACLILHDIVGHVKVFANGVWELVLILGSNTTPGSLLFLYRTIKVHGLILWVLHGGYVPMWTQRCSLLGPMT